MSDSNKKEKLRKKQKKTRAIRILLIVLCLLVFVGILICINLLNDVNKEGEAYKQKIELPWENGGKMPSEYTLEEFEKLDEAQQELFFEWFETVDEFNEWRGTAQIARNLEEIKIPWENGGKMPSEYTLEEFEKLDEVQQELFFKWFETVDGFNEWREAAQIAKNLEEIKIPWGDGDKMPSEYTLEEFEKLDEVQQELFFEWFESMDKFNEWKERVSG